MSETETLLGEGRKSRVPTLLALLPIALLGAVLGANAAHDFGDASFVASCLRAGTLPTWHPGLDLGRPFSALTPACPWYPPHWIWIAVEPARAAPPLLALHLFVGGLGALLFAADRRFAFLFALACQAVLLLAALYGSPDSVQPASWLPWFAVSLRGVRAGLRGSEFRAAAACSLMLLSGSLGTGIFLAAAGLLLALGLRTFRLDAVLIATTLGFTLAGVRLLPGLEAAHLDFANLGTPALREQRAQEPSIVWIDAFDQERPGSLAPSRPAPHRIDVQVEGSSGGWIVFREPHAPDWKCNVNGRDSDVDPTEHGARRVRLPAGDSLVRTWYEPWSLRLGTLLTLVSFLLLLRRRAREPA